MHEGGFWGVIGGLNDNLANFGFAVVGIFKRAAKPVSCKALRRISSDVGPSRMANNAPRPITHKTDYPHDHDFDGARPAPC